MIQRGDGLGFPFEAHLACGIGGKMLRENLDRNRAVKTRVASAVDFAHTTRAEGRQYFVRTELCAWSQRHNVRRL